MKKILLLKQVILLENGLYNSFDYYTRLVIETKFSILKIDCTENLFNSMHQVVHNDDFGETREKKGRNKRKTREWFDGVVIDAFMISRIDDWGSNISFMPTLYTSYVFGNHRPFHWKLMKAVKRHLI